MELIDYVTNTPQNTNRTILKQLVNNEKNKAVYESVEELKRDGGVGYTDDVKRGTFIDNGDKEYLVTFPGELLGLEGGIFCYTSNIVLNKGDIISITLRSVYRIGNESYSKYYAKESLCFEESEESRVWSTPSGNYDSPVIAVICFLSDILVDETLTLPKGTYILKRDNGDFAEWPEEVSYRVETIHPISEKYLPGVCLPVVELTPENLDDPSWNYLTKAENDKLNEISKTHLAFLAKVNLKVPETFLMLRKWSSGAEIPVYNGSNPFAGGSVHGYTSVQLLGDDPNEWVMCVYDNRVT